MLKKGKYKTVQGLNASITTIKPVNGNHWKLIGYIDAQGVKVLHAWDINGASLTGVPMFDIDEEDLSGE